MNEILLYLTLKYNGQWLDIYDSLKNKEKITSDQLSQVHDQIDCDYKSLLDDNYPEAWKNVYKPPLSIFSYGKFELINHNPIVTIYGEINELNKPYLDCIVKNNGCLLWPDLSNKQMLEVLKNYRTKNLFWLPELKNEDNRTFHHILEDEEIKNNNLFYSEIWQKKIGIDYSQQMPERMYLGLSKYVLVLDKLDSKQLLSLASYASIEDVKIVMKAELFEGKMRKIFTKCKLWIIHDTKEILDYFFEQK